MGFMAGFGKGFANSFAQGEQQRAIREQDAFRVAYDEYQRKKAQFEEQDSAWSKALKQGELIAQKNGAPPEAVPKIAEWLMSGASDTYVDDMVKNTKFSTTPDVPLASDQNPVDAQMVDTGLAPPIQSPEQAGVDPTMPNPIPDPNQADPNAPVAPAQNTDLLGGILGPDGIFKNAGKSDIEQANSQVMEAGGIDQAQWDKVNKGFQTPDTSGIQYTVNNNVGIVDPLDEFDMGSSSGGIDKDKAKAIDIAAKQWAKSKNPEDQAKAARWEILKPDVELALAVDALDPQTKADLLKPLAESRKERTEFAKQRSAAKTMLDQGKALADMAKSSDGKVLQATSGAVSFFESFKTEAGAVLDLIGKLGNDQTQTEESVLSAALAELDKAVGGGTVTPEIAQEYREFTAASIRYIFAVGRALGTEGNGFSNKDYDNIRNAILTSNDKDAFANNLKRMAQEQFGATTNTINELMIMPEIQILWDDEFVGPSLRKQLQSPDEMFANDANYKWMKSPMTKSGDPLAGTLEDVAAPETAATQTDTGSPIGTRISADGKTIYEKIKAGPDTDASTFKKVN